jgi:Heterokaryon incompatibility protein (HET)
MANAQTDDMDSEDSSEDFVFVEDPNSSRPDRDKVMRKSQVCEEASDFQHQILPSIGHFRLLRLTAGEEQDDIVCSLTPFEIDSLDRPAYRAISYTWGSDEAVYTIRIEDKTFRVRKNLMALLRCVRHSQHDCWLWIDAICIDQKSNKERNHQVKLMGKIYSNANLVVAWLESSGENGGQYKDIGYAFDFMSSATSFNTLGISMAAYCESLAPTKMVWDRPTNGMVAWEDDWYCFAMFCKLQYWTRKWIIQEVVAARTVVLQTGRKQCPMTIVEDFFGQLDGNPYRNSYRYESLPKSSLNGLQESELARYHKWELQFGKLNLSSTPVALLARHRLGRRTGKDYPQSLHELLPRYEHYECKEPSDHVYALFNLIGEHRQHLDVDYAQNPADRCQAILHFMQKHDGLSPSETVCSTILLIKKLGLRSETNVRGTLQRIGRPEMASMMATMFDRGETILLEESQTTLFHREKIAALHPMQTWSLRKVASHWEVRSNSSYAHAISGLSVSPYDLTCFKVRETNLFGLAATRVENGDRVWQFRETNLAFIVRVSKEDQIAIVGRTLLFLNDAQKVEPDRLGPEIESSTQTSAPEKIVSTKVLPEQHDILLSCADLLELAFWADSMGPAANPFMTEGRSFQGISNAE